MPNPFDTSAMAAGYATSRPAVHPRVVELARPHLPRARRALDVGCGAGLSTRALAPVAKELVGIEPAAGMLAFTRSVAPMAHFAVGSAEAMPFADRSFDLLTAAGSLNYVRLDDFFAEACRVLRPSGALLVYDYSHGRSFRDDDSLTHWFAAFLDRYPAQPSQARPLNPHILRDLDARFALGAHEEFEIGLTLTREFYVEYLLSSTNVGAALQRGATPEEVRNWCATTLFPVWGDAPREVLFRGYWAVMPGPS